MIDAGSTIGLFEIGSLPETQDFADASRFQPELRTSTALQPDSRAHPGDPGQRRLDGLRPAVGGADLGPGLRDQPERLGPPRARHRRYRGPERDDPDVHPSSGVRPAPWPRAGRRPRTGRRRRARSPGQAEGAARGDPRAVPQGVALRRRRGPGPSQGRVSPRPTIPGSPPWSPTRRGQKPVIFHAEPPHRDPRRPGDRQGAEAEGRDLGRRRGLEGRAARSRRPASPCSSAARSTCPRTTTILTTRPTPTRRGCTRPG